MSNKLLINATNLHVGGGVQVAVSFIYELTKSNFDVRDLTVFVSTEVARELEIIGADISCFYHYEVFDMRGFCLFSKKNNKFNTFSRVFTVFGPLYRWRPPFQSIVGFAQLWIIYSKNDCYPKIPLANRLLMRLMYLVKGMFFSRANHIVVELAHVKNGVIHLFGFSNDSVSIVHNCLSAIYSQPNLWHNISMPNVECDLKLGFLGRNYIHKNTAIFPEIVDALRDIHNIIAKFFVTFTEEEWHACSPKFKSVCVNVGPLAVAQCPNFYKSLDAVVFPSLLECFSSTPLEAMAMEKPLFASDRSFNRDICGQHAHYFNPLDPSSAAQSIAIVFAGTCPDTVALQAAREHAINFSNSKKRAEKYMALLMGDTPTRA